MARFIRVSMFMLLLLILTGLLCGTLAEPASETDWVCPTCGRINTAEMNFCGGCRTAKPTAVEVDPSDAINGWVCSGCGHICSSEDIFCTNCGADHYETDQAAVLIKKPTLEEFRMDPCDILRIDYNSGVQDGKNWYYNYTAPRTGRYCMWIEGQNSNFAARMNLYDMNGKRLTDKEIYMNDVHNYGYFSEGEQFQIFVGVQSGWDQAFTLCIGMPRGPIDLKEPCVITDSFIYRNQRNSYRFVPELSGLYVLEVTEMKSEHHIILYVKDELGYTLANTDVYYGTGMGGKLKFRVEAGKEYYISAIQENSLSDYKLSLFCPNPAVSVTGVSAIGDFLYYPGQTNCYELIAPETGEYGFSFGYIDNGNDLDLIIYDDLDYEVKRHGSGKGTIVELEVGNKYRIMVKQQKGFGAYTLLIFPAGKINAGGKIYGDDPVEIRTGSKAGDNGENYSAVHYPIILDEADLFSDEEEIQLATIMTPICDYCTPILWTAEDIDPRSLSYKAELLGKSISGLEEYTIYAINTVSKTMALYSTENTYKVLTTEFADSILDSVKGNDFESIKDVFEKIHERLELELGSKEKESTAESD